MATTEALKLKPDECPWCKSGPWALEQDRDGWRCNCCSRFFKMTAGEKR